MQNAFLRYIQSIPLPTLPMLPELNQPQEKDFLPTSTTTRKSG
jgi:hypothetical protein